MKLFIAAMLALVFAAAKAQDTSLAFPNTKLEPPLLSLVEGARGISNPLTTLNSTAEWFRQQSGTAHDPKTKWLSRMPIVSREFSLDSKMAKAPDPSIDYKLIVKSPNIESAK